MIILITIATTNQTKILLTVMIMIAIKAIVKPAKQ